MLKQCIILSLSFLTFKSIAAPVGPCTKIEKTGVEKAISYRPYTSNLVFSFQLAQLRTAVAAVHGDQYHEGMSIEETNALGEEVQFKNASVFGKKYQVVNVGFGGGNSAAVFFPADTLEPAPFKIIDGSDCLSLSAK